MTQRPLHIFVPHPSAILTDHLPNGDGLIAYTFLQHLAARGHHLYVVAQRVELRQPLPANVHLWSSGAMGDTWTSRLKHMLYARRIFAQVNRDTRLDLIHQLNPVFAGISLAQYDSRLPLVLGTYVPHWPSVPTSLKKRLIALLLHGVARLQQSSADRLLLTTPAALARIAGQRSDAWLREHVRWLHHGIDTDVFAPANVPARPQSVLFLANVEERKGIVQLVHAFAQVLHTMPDATLTVAGDGAARPAAEQAVAALGIGHAVTFLGSVAREDVPGVMRRHSCYCLPSLGEPYATSLMEAMSCGLPCVVSNTGGLRHMLAPGGGLYAQQDDVPALADALNQMLSDPAAALAMGAINRAYVLEHLSWPACIAKLESIYAELIAP